jgi:hypothetical protein
VLDRNRRVLTLDGNDSSGGVVIAVQFDEDVARGAASCIGEAAQFLEVLSFPGRLDEHVDRVAVAGLGEPAQLVEITAFAGHFDELVLGVRSPPAAA